MNDNRMEPEIWLARIKKSIRRWDEITKVETFGGGTSGIRRICFC